MRVQRAEDRAVEAAQGFRVGEQPAAEGGILPGARQADSDRGRQGKLLWPARRRACIEHILRTHILRVASFATSTGSTSNAGAITSAKLISHLGRSMRAAHAIHYRRHVKAV